MAAVFAKIGRTGSDFQRAGIGRLGVVGRFSTGMALLFVAVAVRTAASAVVEISDLYGTGAATQSLLVANGATDPHYQVTVFQSDTTASGTQAPYGAYPPPDPSIFTGTPSAYSIDPFQALSPNVTSGSRVSQWITPPGSFTSTGTPFTPAGQNVIAPVGLYVYETTFTLPSSLTDLTRIFISGSFAGDNLTPNALLNGSPIPGAAGGGRFSYETTTPLSSLFIAGTNRLAFRVRNILVPESPNDFFNPTGLHVNITGGYYETSPTVIPEIDPASFSGVFSIVLGSLAVAERRMRRRRA